MDRYPDDLKDKPDSVPPWEIWFRELDELIAQENCEPMKLHLLQLKDSTVSYNLRKESIKDGVYRFDGELSLRSMKILKIFHRRLLFDELIDIMKEGIFSQEDIEKFCSEISPSLRNDQLFSLIKHKEIIGLAPITNPSGIVFELIQRRDPLIRSKLIEEIKNKTEEMGQDKNIVPYSQYHDFWSSFSFICLAPEGTDLSYYLEILFNFNDLENKDFFIDLLKKLPWGEDSWPTVKLIDLLSKSDDSDYHQAIKDCLKIRFRQTPGRLYLIEGIYNFSKDEVVNLLLKELISVVNEDYRTRVLSMLKSLLEKEPGLLTDTEETMRIIKSIKADKWTSFEKVFFERLIKKTFKSPISLNISGISDKIQNILVQSFLRVRIDHMGCGLVLPLLFVVGYLVIVGMDLIFGKPSNHLIIYTEFGLLLLWVVVVGVTSTTHFSGSEKSKDLTSMAQVYWLSFFAWFFGALGIHIYSVLTK
jgi:hypothetical protein